MISRDWARTCFSSFAVPLANFRKKSFRISGRAPRGKNDGGNPVAAAIFWICIAGGLSTRPFSIGPSVPSGTPLK